MSRKNLNTSVSIPVWQIIATALLLYLLPPPESVETILLSALKYKQSVLVVKALLLSIVVLIPFYLHQRATRPFPKAKREQLLSAIQNDVVSEYELHRNNVLDGEFRKAVNKEAARGFDLPVGTLNGAIIDLYKNEFAIFGSILEKSINSVTANISTKGLYPYLSSLVVTMLNGHNSRIKADYKRAADGYWEGKIGNLDLNEHFAKVADHETQLQIDKLLAVNNLNEIKT